MRQPETRYTRAGDAEIAYQTVGDGPVDLVWAFGLMTHLEIKWEEPSLAAMLERLSGFTRLILFDRRGCGLSDRGDRFLAPSLEERVQDVVAVLDAIGSRRASFFGVSEGCALAALFASVHPHRTGRLVLYGGISRLLRDAEHPWGVLDDEQYAAAFGPVFRHWGTREGAAAHVRLIAPSAADDPDYLDWFARQQRLALSRDAVVRFMDTATRYDLDEVFPVVRVPTLVLHRSGDAIVPSSSAERVAAKIPGARLVELPGVDHLPYVGDAASVVEAVRNFLDVPDQPVTGTHRLVNLLATDAHDAGAEALVRRHVRRWGGTEVSTESSGGAACFESATHAVRCALAIVRSSGERGVVVRAAVHTGECAVVGRAVGGAAAEVPSVLLPHAPPGRVVASGTVRDVVPGAEIAFTDERRIHLPGSSGEVVVTTVVDPSADSSAPEPRDRADRVFRLNGEYWTVSFEGREATLRDSKGMHDLAVLLAHPGRERHVLDLWSGAASSGTSQERSRLLRAASRQPLVDEEARARYQRRLAELDGGEGSLGDPEALTGRLAEERDWIVRELAAAYGIGGRARSVPDEVERARKAVYRRISDALRRIEHAHRDLGRHLKHSIHTGVYCSYTPERELSWTTAPATCAMTT